MSVRQGRTYSLATIIPTANVYHIHDSTANCMAGYGDAARLGKVNPALIGAVVQSI